MKKIFSIAIAGMLAVSLTGCRDDFAELNQDPAAVVTANPSYLFVQGVNKFEPMGYLLYYYNAPMTYSWTQMGIPTNGITTNILTTSNTGDQGSKYIETLRYVRDLENYFNTQDEASIAQNKPYLDALNVLTAYLGIFDSDMYGNLSFTEACRARYSSDPSAIRPGYDNMKDLYDLWLTQLDDAIKTFTADGATMSTSQDIVYKGDLKKWAKFANSLKLRIAVRLQAQDMTRAKSIASAVKSASCGYIDSLDDAVLFNKATTVPTEGGNNGGDLIYHWSNGFLDGTAGSTRVIELMKNNLDPRVRFCYQKNDWNSKVVQAYYDRGQEIPDFIEKNVIRYTADEVAAIEEAEKELEDSKKTKNVLEGKLKTGDFKAWAGAGEPWVRYYGLPTAYNPTIDPQYDWYFKYSNHKIGKADGSSQKAYQTFSQFQQMMIIGRGYGVSVPTTPEDVLSVTTNDRPWYGMYLGGAEVNLYLAEFAMLDNKEAEAKQYYDRALELSVMEYDKLASLNKIAYYGTTYDYDPNEVSIEMKPGEIEAMMEGTDYAFTGTPTEKLEKIYIQQLLNFTLYPNEQYVTARRSGYPKINSTILAREVYSEIPVTKIPRRFDTGTPVESDLRYQIKMDNFKSQGFTITSNGAGHSDVLHNERVWADLGAPEWGAGK